MNCSLCGEKLAFQWSDTHGIGVCVNCGLPYSIYHYEEIEGKSRRVDKPPAIAIKEEWLPIGRQYWGETKRRAFPAAYDMGFLSGRSRTYSGASREDCEAWDAWLMQHRKELPPPAAGEKGD